MGTIKKCGRCGKTAPHHHELDEICMQCEMEIHYPDDDAAKSFVQIMQSCTIISNGIDRTEDAIKKIAPKKNWINKLLGI